MYPFAESGPGTGVWGAALGRFSLGAILLEGACVSYGVSLPYVLCLVPMKDLKDYMRQAGEVTYADAHKLRRNEGWVTFLSRAVTVCFLLVLTSFPFVFRVVEFATYSDMKNALDKLDNTDLSGRRIRLVEEKRLRRR